VRYLLDSNICILLLGSEAPGIKSRLRECDEGDVGISAITLAEVALGSWNGKLPPPEILDAFTRDVPPLPFDAAAAACYARLPFKRRNFDRLIAAHAVSLGLTLVTNNEADFQDIPGLAVENWAS